MVGEVVLRGNLLTRTLVALSDAGVRFVVCGGVACVLQGVARATHDLDVRVRLTDDDLRALIVACRAVGLTPRIPEPIEAVLDPARRHAWIVEMRAVVYTLLAPDGSFSLDVFLRYPLTFEELDAVADVVVIEGRSVKVSSKAHLIVAKRAVDPPRTRDLRDIADLEELLRGDR